MRPNAPTQMKQWEATVRVFCLYSRSLRSYHSEKHHIFMDTQPQRDRARFRKNYRVSRFMFWFNHSVNKRSFPWIYQVHLWRKMKCISEISQLFSLMVHMQRKLSTKSSVTGRRTHFISCPTWRKQNKNRIHLTCMRTSVRILRWSSIISIKLLPYSSKNSLDTLFLPFNTNQACILHP